MAEEQEGLKKKNVKYEIDMCNGPLAGKILMFALPLMLSSILQLLFNAADVVVVGKFAGSESLAAVGSTTALINLITNLFMGLSVGVNVSIAHYYGAKREKDINETVHTAILLSIIAGIVLTIVGVSMAKIFLMLMGSPSDVIDLATLYLRVYFCGMTAVMLYNFGSAILRAVGDTRRPLIYLFLAGIINVLFNLLFVIVFKMGVAGVGLATAISQSVSAFLVVRCLMKETGSLRLKLKALHLYKDKFLSIIKIGLPAGIQGTIFSLSNVVIQSAINSFASIVMAGSAAAANIEGFVYMAMNAFHQTALTFTGQNYGAGKLKRIDKIIWISLGMVTFTGVVFGNTVVLFGEKLLHIYSDNDEVIAAGIVRLTWVCAPYALCGIMDVLVGVLRGLNCAILPVIVSLLGACGLRLLWIATVFQKYHTPKMLYVSYPVSWAVTICVHVICLFIVRKRINGTQNIV
jgi:putative MATE family efflux protein